MSRHRMRAADAAWLRMDRPTNLMIVTSAMWFDEPLDPDELRNLIAERMVDRFPRFSQRVVEDHGLFWEDVANFDLDRHLHPVQLPEPAGKAELEAFTSSLVSVPLSRTRPLWDLYLVENYAAGYALVFRMHHAIADGIALARLLLTLTDDPDVEPTQVADLVDENTPSMLSAGITAGLDVLRHPMRLAAAVQPHHLLDLAHTAIADAAALAKLTLMPNDQKTALRGEVGVSKRALWSEPIALDLVRTAGHEAGATVNDLLLTAVSGALRRHLVRRRSEVHEVRAIVPFNLRPLDVPLPAELGNMFGLVYLPLPLTTPRREDRLAAMRERTRAIKESAEGAVAYGILELVGMAPPAVENIAIDVFAAKGTGVMTNVPGPHHPVYLTGRPLRGTIGWGPTSGNLGLGVALFSYAGTVTIGLCVDTGLVPDPESLLDDIVDELDELVRAHTPVAVESPR